MNMESAISVFAGGIGSGCNPAVGKCGRNPQDVATGRKMMSQFLRDHIGGSFEYPGNEQEVRKAVRSEYGQGVTKDHEDGAVEKWNEYRKASQDALRKQYGDTMTLYRGVREQPRQLFDYKKMAVATKNSPISFSESKEAASRFANRPKDWYFFKNFGPIPDDRKVPGHLITAHVPTDSVVVSHHVYGKQYESSKSTGWQKEIKVAPEYQSEIKWESKKV